MNAPAHPSAERLHYMDNLRALAMLAGVLFHAALAYSPMLHFFWPSADAAPHKAYDVLAWFSHLFRMPLFFLIAGFFAALLLERRGVQAFLLNRTLRIALPFVLFLGPVLWAIGVGFDWAVAHVEKPSPLLGFVRYQQQSGGAMDMPFSTAHLWFLYYLAMFCAALALLWIGAQLRGGAWLRGRWLDWLARPWCALPLAVIALTAVFAAIEAPHPAPESLWPKAWPFGLYGLFFLLGALIYARPALLQSLNGWLWPLLLVGLASHIYFIARVPAAAGHWLMALSESLTAVCMTFACLLAGARWLNRRRGAFRYIADASYWIYLVHLPLLFMLQYLLLDVTWPSPIEFTLSVLATFALALLSYALLVRHTPIGWLLNGRRKVGEK